MITPYFLLRKVGISPLKSNYGALRGVLRIKGHKLEISEAYIGQIQKFPVCVIVHRLTNDQTETRLKNQDVREKKKGIVMKDKSKQLMGIIVYITNTPPKEVPTTYVHSLYSLR